MNKKQLYALLAAITHAVQSSTEGMTEDEARTLVGMKLRQAANGIVADSAGVEPEKAAELLTAGHAAIADAAKQKKAAKAKAKKS